MSAFQTNCKIQTPKQRQITLIWYNYCNLNILGHANILPDTPGTEHPNHTEPNKNNTFIDHLLLFCRFEKGASQMFCIVMLN